MPWALGMFAADRASAQIDGLVEVTGDSQPDVPYPQGDAEVGQPSRRHGLAAGPRQRVTQEFHGTVQGCGIVVVQHLRQQGDGRSGLRTRLGGVHRVQFLRVATVARMVSMSAAAVRYRGTYLADTHPFTVRHAMATAVITASASAIVAVLVFVLNRQNQYQFERRQALLARVNAQLRELYGPLQALVHVNELVWKSLRDSSALPAGNERIDMGQLGKHELGTWMAWLNHSLMPANVRMRDLILDHADLIIEAEMPGPLLAFCAHVSAYEVILRSNAESGVHAGNRLIGHPGDVYVHYVDRSFAALKDEQARLLALTAAGRTRFPLTGK